MLGYKDGRPCHSVQVEFWEVCIPTRITTDTQNDGKNKQMQML